MDCLATDNNEDDSAGVGFTEQMANVSYGGVALQYYASSYFCHDYSGRALHEEEQAPTEAQL